MNVGGTARAESGGREAPGAFDANRADLCVHSSAREPLIKIRLRPFGDGEVEAVIHNGKRACSIFSGDREKVKKVLAAAFPGVAIEDEVDLLPANHTNSRE